MFNVTGGEVVIIILAALVILGPEKLPDVVRRAGRLYGELRRMSDGFQSELRSALDEPTREFRETAELAKSSFTGVVDTVKTAVNPGAALTDKVLDGFKGTNGAKPAAQDAANGMAESSQVELTPAELTPAEATPAEATPAEAAAPVQVPATSATAPASWGAPPAEAIGLTAPLPPPSAPLAPPAAFPAPTLPPPAAAAPGEGA